MSHNRYANKLVLPLLLGGATTGLSWLLVAEHSPVRGSVEFLRILFVILQFPATLAASVISGNVHGGALGEAVYWALALLQWLIVSFGLLGFFGRRGGSGPVS